MENVIDEDTLISVYNGNGKVVRRVPYTRASLGHYADIKMLVGWVGVSLLISLMVIAHYLVMGEIVCRQRDFYWNNEDVFDPKTWC